MERSYFFIRGCVNHITGNKNLVKHATAFYKQLFGPGKRNPFDLDNNLWPMEDSVTNLEN
jgi:hypothetical protein